MKYILLSISITFFLSAAQAAQPTQPDNSAVNERDRSVHSPTADDQSTSQRDVEITSEIRKALMADDSLSTYAHNIKIITNNGKVTLKGPVKNEREKQEVYRHASRVAGAPAITNQIEVARSE